jgi:hypothetical protein
MRVLDSELLVAQARETTGLRDFGEDGWQEGLERLLASLRAEARLNELGEQIAAGDVLLHLTTQLQLLDWRREHPEIVGRPVEPPIVLMGQGRTGTTILFDLLAQDPATRVPLTWEVDRPVPAPETATYETDPRIAEVDDVLAGTDLLVPGFRAMHPMGARLAQECVRIYAPMFRSVIFGTTYHVPSYLDWVVGEADMALAYRWHRMFLEHLQSRHPARRWVLKSPAHIWNLDALVAEYPDALLVQTHRDPLRIVASLSALVALLRRLACDDPGVAEAAADWTDALIEGLDRSVAARKDGTVRSDRVVDVHFAEFMADPFVTIRKVYERLDLELTPDAEHRMRDFLAGHPQEPGGRYTFAATGLDEGELRERTRAYEEYFAVPREPIA